MIKSTLPVLSILNIHQGVKASDRCIRKGNIHNVEADQYTVVPETLCLHRSFTSLKFKINHFFQTITKQCLSSCSKKLAEVFWCSTMETILHYTCSYFSSNPI